MEQSVTALAEQSQTASSSNQVEQIIRDQLLMQKPGEIVVQLPPLDSTSQTQIPTPEVHSPLSEWFQLLFP